MSDSCGVLRDKASEFQILSCWGGIGSSQRRHLGLRKISNIKTSHNFAAEMIQTRAQQNGILKVLKEIQLLFIYPANMSLKNEGDQRYSQNKTREVLSFFSRRLKLQGFLQVEGK